MAKVQLELEAETLQDIGNLVSFATAVLNRDKEAAAFFMQGLTYIARNEARRTALNAAMDNIGEVLAKAGINVIDLDAEDKVGPMPA